MAGQRALADTPNQIWVGDITYLPTGEGWLNLAVILDACSRKIVGWQIEDHLQSSLMTEALKQAQERRGPAPGLLHHVQYASSAQRALLAIFHITASMSRKATAMTTRTAGIDSNSNCHWDSFRNTPDA